MIAIRKFSSVLEYISGTWENIDRVFGLRNIMSDSFRPEIHNFSFF